MSELPDHDRIREMLRRLEDIQRESVELRHRIERVRACSPEFPARSRPSNLFEGISKASTLGHGGGDEADAERGAKLGRPSNT